MYWESQETEICVKTYKLQKRSTGWNSEEEIIKHGGMEDSVLHWLQMDCGRQDRAISPLYLNLANCWGTYTSYNKHGAMVFS